MLPLESFNLDLNPKNFKVTLPPISYKNWNVSINFPSVKVNKIIFPGVLNACPPPLGTDPPSGCNKTFVEDVDGEIPCQDDLDCPENEEWFNKNGCKIPSEESGSENDQTLIKVGHCLQELRK